MKHTLLSMCLLFSGTLPAAEVVEDFETGNPNGWIWGANSAVIKTSDGNPASWLDSGVEFFASKPFVDAVPPIGSDLQIALSSGALQSVRFNFQRLDGGSCFQSSNPSTFGMSLIDLHTLPGFSVVAAYSGVDPSPTDVSDWQTHSMTIDSQATDTPDGWILNGAPDGYTWQDMMHNVDGIALFAVDPNSLTFGVACWRLGVDNIVVGYGDQIYSSGFE
jgi:hypothetical protein